MDRRAFKIAFALGLMTLSNFTLAQGKFTVGAATASDPTGGKVAVVTINGHNFGYLPMPGGDTRARTIARRISKLLQKGSVKTAGLKATQLNGMYVVGVNKSLVPEQHIITADVRFARRRNRSPQALSLELTEELKQMLQVNNGAITKNGRIRSLGGAPPTTASGWYDAGMEAFGKQDYDKAEESFQKAADIEPTYTEAYLALAGTQAAAKKTDALRDTLDKIENRIGEKKLNPDQKNSYNAFKTKLKSLSVMPQGSDINSDTHK